MDTYLGKNVWNVVPRTQLEFDIINSAELMGKPWQLRYKAGEEATERIIRLSLLQASLAERNELQEFYDECKGALTAFWIQSYKDDYALAQPAPAGSVTITLKGESEGLALATVKRHIYFPALDEGYRLSSPAPAPGGGTQVTISPSLSGALPLGSALRNLYLVRYNKPLAFQTNNLSHSPVTTSWAVELQELQGETP